VTNAEVTSIAWAKSNGPSRVAQSVKFVSQGTTYTVNVKKEVIVSAGTIGSPRLLELSGVGDPSVLKSAGVQSVVNLPGVGNNLIEHTLVPLVSPSPPSQVDLN
jgi:choline dehydrogenase-like flavoprotein